VADDLNFNIPDCNIQISDLSDEILLALFPKNDIQISAPQRSTHYNLQENGKVLDMVLHKNILLSDVIFSAILVSNHLTNHFPRTG
jgi:hypothetical protein